MLRELIKILVIFSVLGAAQTIKVGAYILMKIHNQTNKFTWILLNKHPSSIFLYHTMPQFSFIEARF